MQRTILLLASLLLLSRAYSQEASDSTRSEGNFFAVPLIFLTPETSWGFGAAGIYTFRFKGERAESRPSQLQLGGAYTLENQILSYLPFQLFWKDELYNFYGEFGFYRYNYFFYGIGNEFEDYEGELFDVTYPRVRINALRAVEPRLYVGIRYWMDRLDISGFEEGGLLDEQPIPGKEGGWVTGLGPMLTWDNRDNVFYPSQGSYLELASLFNGDWIGSDYSFTKITLDARAYFKNRWGHILAGNLYLENNAGNVPYMQMALMGGTRRMRGYYEGRFRDRSMGILQAAYRFPLVWRLKMSVFGGYGAVSDEISELNLSDFRYTVGLGLRILLLKEEKAHVRLDYGLGKNTSGIYITIGEAF
jgi:outer membrane protein assembly factor BamA